MLRASAAINSQADKLADLVEELGAWGSKVNDMKEDDEKQALASFGVVYHYLLTV
jgi:hypothetical protein